MTAATLWPYALAAVLILAIVIVILLVLVLRKASKVSQFSGAEPEEEEEGEETQEAAPAAGTTLIASAFRRGKEILRLLSQRNIYRTPLQLLIGAEGSRKPQFLASLSTLEMPVEFADPMREGLAFANGCGFFFFQDGVVVDLAGEHILSADAATGDERTWKTLLSQLQQMRPRRPADGVIITISCKELVAANADEAGKIALAARAEQLHHKLWEIQRDLGFRLPVYILVTGCDELRGFEDFTAGLPSTARGQLLGWSSPYQPDVPYNNEWLDVAFTELHASLTKLQLGLFAERKRSEELMLFPWQIGALKQPLRTFLSHLFRASAYRESMFTRGFYFCGEYRDETAFAADLLTLKAFPEAGLARPSSSLRTARDRKVRMLQIATAAAAAFTVFALLWGAVKFRHEQKILDPFLDTASKGMYEYGALTEEQKARQAEEIVREIAKVDFRKFGSWLVPSSWPVHEDAFDRQLDAAIAAVFREIVLDATRIGIEGKVEDAIRKAGNVVPGAEKDMNVLPIEAAPEFRRLQTFVAQVREAEAHAKMLEDLALPGHGDLRVLGDVVQYAFGRPLDDHFFRRGELYARALRQVRHVNTVDPTHFRARTSSTAITLAADLYRRLYRDNRFAQRLDELQALLHPSRIESQYSGGTETFKAISETMHAIERDLAGPQLQWAFQPAFDLGRDYNAVVTSIDESKYFDDQTAGMIRGDGSAGWALFRGHLRASSPVIGPFLAARDGNPEMRLSTDAAVLQSAIDSFLHQGFVNGDGGGRRLETMLASNERFTWDTSRLQHAAALAASYDRFRDKGLRMFSPEMQLAVDQAARAKVGDQLAAYLAEAQHRDVLAPPATAPQREHMLRRQIQDFSATLKPVAENLSVLERLGLQNTRNDLAAAATAEALRLLSETDALLTEENVYMPLEGNFGWWHGRQPASPEVWGKADAAELEQYLQLTRARVGMLATSYAKPLLTWLADAGMNDLPEATPLVTRWQSIVEDLQDQEAKKPGNAADVLEDYILNRMTKVTLRNCTGAALATRPQRARGFYAQRVDTISRQLAQRCWVVASAEASRQYRELATYFNSELRDHYPFAERVPELRDKEAKVEDVRRFFETYDRIDALLASIPVESPYGDDLAAARNFVRDMSGVRRFFAPFLDAKTPQRVPVIGVEPHFRTLRDREVGGQEIIRWELTVGNDTVSDRDKGKKLSWTPGQKVTLAVRWASDAPHTPKPVAKRRGVDIEIADRTITYRYANQWALLSALQDLTATQDVLGAGIEVLPVTLALNVPLELAANGTEKTESVRNPDPALVFVRMGLLAPDGTPLEVPSFPFPYTAPSIATLAVEDIR